MLKNKLLQTLSDIKKSFGLSDTLQDNLEQGIRYSISVQPTYAGACEFLIKGWCFLPEGKKPEEIFVEYNGIKLQIIRFNRPDVLDFFNNILIKDQTLGFIARAKYKLLPKLLVVHASDHGTVYPLFKARIRQTLHNRYQSILLLLKQKPIALPHAITGVDKQESICFNIDHPTTNAIAVRNNPIRVAGWVFDEKGAAPHHVQVEVGNRLVHLECRQLRSDVTDAFPDQNISAKCGFDGTFSTGYGFKWLKIIAHWEDGSHCCIAQRLYWIKRSTNLINRSSLRESSALNKTRGKELRLLYNRDCEAAATAKRPASPNTVDIIIPVYRGFEETRQCLKSLYKAQTVNKSTHEIVVIDDCCPEPELSTYLQNEANHNRITLLKNTENLGFVGSVNRGMCLHEERNVILLNSDTEVFGNWLDRIVAVAQNNQRVATITPLSNNATICSYPECTIDNNIPSDTTPRELDDICQEENLGFSCEVPTGVGYCMYVSRNSLNALGYFDLKTFGTGYGEENDFCLRAWLKGWKNLLTCDTFVYHKGSVSFLDTAKPKVEKAISILKKIHPSFEHRVKEFIDNDPPRSARLNIDRRRIEQLPLRRILCISNARAGGTLQHIVDTSKRTKSASAYFLARASTYAPNTHYEIFLLPDLTPINTPKPGLLVKEIAQFCDRHKITALEYHHLADQDPEKIMQLPTLTGLPFSFIAHDYFSYCPQITLTTKEGKYCEEPGISECQTCLSNRPKPFISNICKWRNIHRTFLTQADSVRCPSAATSSRLRKHFPEANIETVPHLEDNASTFLETPDISIKVGEVVRVGILGALSREKGADLLEATAIDAAQRNLPIHYTLFGYAYRILRCYPEANLTILGPYSNRELSQLFDQHKQHLIWFPALWPETYSYTLSIAMENRFPVLVPNLGAFPERVEGRPHSTVIPWDSTAQEINDLIMKQFKKAKSGVASIL